MTALVTPSAGAMPNHAASLDSSSLSTSKIDRVVRGVFGLLVALQDIIPFQIRRR